ncbi:MAG: glycosyltransferase family 25 protein, partial [Flammeovirgaceae bacterium]
MKKQMAYLKLPYTRIQAVDGKLIEKYLNEGNAEKARGVLEDVRIKWDPITHTRGFGEAGCGLSHIRTLLSAKDRIEQGEALDGPVLVLEDDVEISQDLVKDLRVNVTWLNEKHPNWKLFVVGHCVHSIIDQPAIDQVAEIDGAKCTHAYILNGMKAIDEMLDTINVAKYPDPID